MIIANSKTLVCRLSTVLFLLVLWIDHIGAKEVRIVCYYTNWSVYRPGDAKFNPQNINPYLCTHLVYAFGGFTKENTLKPFDKYQDVEKGGYAKFVGLKTYNKNLKTLLAIGGWNEGSSRFSPMVANADRRKELVKNTIKFLRQNHFDGLDLDWEYPSFRDGGKARDRDNYAQFVQDLREEFERESEKTGRPRLLLTMAVPAGIEYIKKGYDIPKLTKYLDWMNILSYDYHSAYEPAINHHSPLYPIEEESEYSYDIDLNIDYTIKHYIQSGADKSKLVLGIPTYGRSYTLYNPDANEIGSPADGPGEMGEATRENGYLAYYEICENVKSEEWKVENPYPGIMGPYAYKDDQWVSYDDANIARKKSEYVAEHGLGGIMFWSIDNDDFRGKCGDRQYPIIEAAKEALLKAYGLRDSNLLEATKKPIKSRTRSRTRGTTKALSTTQATILSNSGGRQTSRRKPHRITGKGEGNSIPRRRRPSIKKSTPTTTESISVGSSLLITPSYTTPAPPSTPDSGGEFKCEDEGFFPHPRDCRKYFWCLSGPSDLGIIAHQFTCPAGLYFNKAAASCDYTQNVLCNKKLSKPSTTITTTTTPSSTTTSTTVASIFSTRRPPPRITAATSRTTFTSTSEPEYEEEYEYYDDEEEAENPSKDTEEDPRVIKELIELIRKAGGLEELEKQLKVQDDASTVTSSGSTTQSSLSKSLFQRVLGRSTLKDSLSKPTPRYNFINRNSRGPQNEGISQEKKDIRPTRTRPQYTSIIRSRPSTAATLEETEEEDASIKDEESEIHETNERTTEQSKTPYRKSQPEYVTIKRQRISTTTAESLEDDKVEGRGFSRKQLGEDGDFIENTEENDKIVRNTLFSSTTPAGYVTIRRSRPTTVAADTTDPSDETKVRGTILTEDSKVGSTTTGPEYVTIHRQRPSMEADITTTKYVEIRTRGTTTPATTTASDLNDTELPTTTIRFRSTTTIIEKELTTPTSNERIVSNVEAINNTSAQIDTSNLVEENTVDNLHIERPADLKLESGNVEETNIINNATEIKIESELTTTTVSSEAEANSNEVDKKKESSQFEKRPHFNLRRTTTVPQTTSEPTTQQTSKVSLLTTPRNLFRKKAFGARDSLFSRSKLNKITDNNGNKENSVIDLETKTQYDDNNENQLVDRKRFRNSIPSDKTSENSFEIENNSKENSDNTEYKIRVRNRGQSRFTLQTIGTTPSPRPRIIFATGEPDVDYETTEYIRKYRPDISQEIADLSSLTAVDLKNSLLNRRNGFGRRRRPTIQIVESTPTTSTTTTTAKPEPALKTGSRTIPLARKFLENTSFGKNRRLRPATIGSSTTEGSIVSTINDEAQATEKRFISKLRRPINKIDLQTTTSKTFNESTTETTPGRLTPKVPRFRKFTNPALDVTSSTTSVPESSPLENLSTTRKPLVTRRRKILRRLRTSTQRPEITALTSGKTTSALLVSSTENTFDSNTPNITSISPVEENLNINIITKTDLLDLYENQTTLLELPTTTPFTPITDFVKGEENTTDKREDDLNVINGSDNIDVVDDKSKDDLDSKSNEDDDEEEGENIKLSESIVRENSQIGDFQNGNVIRSFGKPLSINSYRSDLSNEKVENIKFTRRPVTEPNIIIRTKKIIRKLNPTESPLKSDGIGNKKIRKIIRRLRPTTSPLNQIDSSPEKSREDENAHLGYLGRRRFGYNRQSTSTTETVIDEGSREIGENVKESTSKPLFGKRRYNSFTRKGTFETPKSKASGLKTEKSIINKSIYTRARSTIPTTSTTSTSTTVTTTANPTTTETALTPEDTTDNLSIDINTDAFTFLDTSEARTTTSKTTVPDIAETTSHTSTTVIEDIKIIDITTEFTPASITPTESFNPELLIDTTKQDEDVDIKNTELDTQVTNEDPATTEDMRKSTYVFLSTETDKAEQATSTALNELSLSTIQEEMTTLTVTIESDNTNTLPSMTTTVTTPSTVSTTKRLIPTTESALSRLLKRRRFGLSSTTESQESSQNEETAIEDKNRFSPLNTRIKLRKFSRFSTEKSADTDDGKSSSGDEKQESTDKIENNNNTLTTEEYTSAITASNEELTSVQATNIETENTDSSTVTLINTESENTSDVEVETNTPRNITFPDEILSTLISESYTTQDLTQEYSTETTNIESDSSTESTVELASKDSTAAVTETLFINFTEESNTSVNDTDDIITSDFNTQTNTLQTATTEEAIYNDTDTTADIASNQTAEVTSTTTTKKPNRLFRPINSRPKYTVRYRPSESTSAAPLTSDSSTKSYSRYKFKSRAKNRFTFSSTTEKYDENEELGYGPVKEFKSILRGNSDIRGRNEYYETKNIGEDEDEEEYEDEGVTVNDNENDDAEPNVHIRPEIYNRPFPYKPINPVLQRPSSFTKVDDDETEYDAFDVDVVEDNVEDDINVPVNDKDSEEFKLNAFQGNINNAVSPVTRASNAPIDLLTKKSTTKLFKSFRSTTPAAVAQNLSEVDIAAINERNRNLFHKTRKVNSPVAATANSNKTIKNNTIHNTPYQQNILYESGNLSTYNTPYYQSSLSSSTESLYTLAANITFPADDKFSVTDTVQNTVNEVPATTEPVQIASTTITKDVENTKEPELTQATEKSSTLLFETTEEPKPPQITEKSSTLLHIFAETEAPFNETTTNDNNTNTSTSENKKTVEKLIEINRVIEVYSKEEFKNRTGIVGSKTVKLKTEPIIDKIGSVSRITEIKVVEDKNATSNNTTKNNTSISLDTLTKNIKGDGNEEKRDYNFSIPIVTSADVAQINQIHIDSGSMVNKIASKPFYKAETSTIPLEGLFQTESPLKYHHNIKYDSPNEILEGEHSRFVNVRILEQDIADRNAKWNPEAKYIPIKILRDEEITMKADVVEVGPENRHQTIKIAPIKVSLETKT